MREAKPWKTGRARRLRRDSTKAELRLWQKLRARSLDDHKFVRQEPIGRYIADFVCREKRLIIEVDGGQHADSESDRTRGAWLTEHNYRVLRFWNNDVMRNMAGALETIAAALQDETPPHPVHASGVNRPLPASGER